MATQVTRRRFTVDEYHRMAEIRVLTEDDRVELIEGDVVEMAPIGSRHAACVKRLAATFFSWTEKHAIVSVQDPVHLTADSELQPDISLLRPRADFYRDAHPRPNDVFLVVEVADTTAEYDRQVKMHLYGSAGVQEAWLVDLEGKRVEVYRSPRPEGYSEIRIVRPGDRFSPQAFPDFELAVEEVMGDG